MHAFRAFCLRWTPFVLAGALLLLEACQSGGEPVPASKPGVPLTITIEPRGTLTRGAIGEFTVTASVLADSTDFALDVDLPESLALFSGDLHRQGAVRANSQFLLTFAVRVPESGTHEIRATAHMGMGAGAFRASAVYTIGDHAARQRPDGGVATERNGEAVREYRLP